MDVIDEEREVLHEGLCGLPVLGVRGHAALLEHPDDVSVEHVHREVLVPPALLEDHLAVRLAGVVGGLVVDEGEVVEALPHHFLRLARRL